MSRRTTPDRPADLVTDHAVLSWLVRNGRIRIAGTDAVLKIADGKIDTSLNNYQMTKQPRMPRRRK